MNRRDFIKNTSIGLAAVLGASLLPKTSKASKLEEYCTEDAHLSQRYWRKGMFDSLFQLRVYDKTESWDSITFHDSWANVLVWINFSIKDRIIHDKNMGIIRSKEDKLRFDIIQQGCVPLTEINLKFTIV